ncbi:MAG: zinc ribbon domain-containing protein [Nanoarchaeota archaeon]|nr:zinc ribbon domain-containing protein [Nanoarchaeota archaeon]MBU1501935.1 zinc ribbon domain-containing protein [Nanoarchaeota archaeon]MBU2459042.1 zinc ribbon domain-containing protein [Nanoarchaeota archaeon]
MFSKKRCENCKEKISDNYNFCPYCRAPLNRNLGEDWGMLGKNDFEAEADGLPNLFQGGIFGKMINSAVRMLEKEIQKGIEEQKSSPPVFGTNMRLMINGKEVNLNGKKVIAQKRIASEKLDLPQTDAKKFSGLPKANPKTSIRRFSDKVVYEINMPGVKSIQDISITQLESSIEVKALGKNKVYQKIIPINFPIRDYNFSERKLTLELEARD